MRLAGSFLALTLGLAGAASAQTALPGQEPEGIVRQDGPLVAAPCYPVSSTRLCPVPPVDVHADGYLPRTVPSQVRLYYDARDFTVLVSPNIVPYELAVRDAANAAVQYCGQEAGERIVARISDHERYAPGDLESWQFSGRCQ